MSARNRELVTLFLAGLCGSTAVTRNVSFAPSTVIPMPPQPLRAARWSRAKSGGAYREKRSRLRVIPSTTVLSTVSVGSAASCGEARRAAPTSFSTVVPQPAVSVSAGAG